jgi:hypothetical protein
MKSRHSSPVRTKSNININTRNQETSSSPLAKHAIHIDPKTGAVTRMFSPTTKLPVSGLDKFHEDLRSQASSQETNNTATNSFSNNLSNSRVFASHFGMGIESAPSPEPQVNYSSPLYSSPLRNTSQYIQSNSSRVSSPNIENPSKLNRSTPYESISLSQKSLVDVIKSYEQCISALTEENKILHEDNANLRDQVYKYRSQLDTRCIFQDHITEIKDTKKLVSDTFESMDIKFNELFIAMKSQWTQFITNSDHRFDLVYSNIEAHSAQLTNSKNHLYDMIGINNESARKSLLIEPDFDMPQSNSHHNDATFNIDLSLHMAKNKNPFM